MVGGTIVVTHTESIDALVPPSWTDNREQHESGYGSKNSTSDDSSRRRRVHTAKSRTLRHGASIPTVNSFRPNTALHEKHQHEPVGPLGAKQQRQQQLNPDPISSNRPPRIGKSRISIDVLPCQKFISNPKAYSSGNSKQVCSERTTILTESDRKVHTPAKKENNTIDYLDDWDSDYSDDWESDINDIQKPSAILQPSVSVPKAAQDSLSLVPADSTAFEVSLCRKRQAAIDNISYRQEINSWKATSVHDVVRLINGLSFGKSLIDRAWIIFYWISQNIEYDVEAYFSGRIRHQTTDDIVANRKGVCDAFGTIFETLCTAVQIECKKISGYAKGYGFQIGQTSFSRPDHAWNVIRLEGHWYLVDSTWGQGHLDKNNCNRKELDAFYFLVRPEQMIYRHFPEDSKWQLLMSPISMNDFLRLPYVQSTFFAHNLDVIHPRHSNMVLFNSSLGLAEVLVRAPSHTVLIGDISQTGSGKTENGSLIQYDADRQLWQCLFAPQRSGFYTLKLYADGEKQSVKDNMGKNQYSCVIQFGLHVPTGTTKPRNFPKTYGLFQQRKCQIFEPLDSVLKAGSKVTIHCRIPGAYSGRLLLDGNWLSEDVLKDGIFKRQITIPRQELAIRYDSEELSIRWLCPKCHRVETETMKKEHPMVEENDMSVSDDELSGNSSNNDERESDKNRAEDDENYSESDILLELTYQQE